MQWPLATMLKKNILIILVIYLTVILCQQKTYAQNIEPFKVDSLWGFKENNGNVQIEPQFQYARPFSNNYAVVVKKNKLGVINKSNQIIISFEFEYLKHLKDDKFIFGYRAKYFGEYNLGVLDTANNVLIEPIYSRIKLKNNILETVIQEDNIIAKGVIGETRSIKNKSGLKTLNGEKILPNEFDYISWLENGLIVLRKDNLQALYNPNGAKLTKFEYIVIGEFNNGLSKVRKGDKYGFINESGKLKIPIEFEMCYPFKNGFSRIELNDKWGIIDTNGKYVFEPKYSFEEMKQRIKTL